jgi:hypothetical protein
VAVAVVVSDLISTAKAFVFVAEVYRVSGNQTDHHHGYTLKVAAAT